MAFLLALLEEMHNFLESYNLRKWTENTDKPITNTKIKTVIKKLPTNKSPGPDGFTGKFYQTFREELRPILLKLFEKVAEEGTLTNPFHEATIWYQNQTKIPQKKKKENYRPISLMNNRCKNPQQNTSNPYPTIH